MDPAKSANDLSYELTDSYDDRLTATPGPQRSNILSNKISNVLSASYADSEIRDALRALDQTNVNNTPDVRRRLRLGIQKEVIDCNAEIIDQFGSVAERLKRIGSTISRLNKCCEGMHQCLAEARRENVPILEEASTLLLQRRDVETKMQLLEALNKHFIISEEGLQTLTANTDTVDDAFFHVLARVKRIHRDCQILLGTENQRLGLELMEQSSRNLNNAYQKLYRWIQREFKSLNFENPQMSSVIRRALKALAERPMLFESCLDFFVEAREHVLLGLFYSALTGPYDGENGDRSTKPIEYHSHDPLRYVGDMLAWTHSASVSEREALENFTGADGDEIVRGIKQGTESQPWSNVDGEAFDGRKALEELAGRNLAGVVQVLRQRVEQVIQNQEDSVTIYKLVNLLCFYRVTFTKLLGGENNVLRTLVALEGFAFHQFQTIMAENVKSVQTDLSKPSPDLRLPNFLGEALDNFRGIIQIFDSSLTPVSSRRQAFEKVTEVALDPFLDICKKICHGAEEPVHSILLINCLQAVQTTLSDYEFVQQRRMIIDEDIRSCMTPLAEFQHAFFLHSSGLYPMITDLASLSGLPPEDIPSISALSSFQPAALENSSQLLDDFLPSALMDATENLTGLSNKQLVSDITAEAAERFCEDFECIEGQLAAFDDTVEHGDRDVGNVGSNWSAPALKQLFPRTSGEIRVLLS